MDIFTRQAILADKEWLYQLYCSTMRVYIERTWGWDEEFQRHAFQTNLHPENFCIVTDGINDVAAYIVNEHDDHFWIEMILVISKEQRKGLGTAILKRLQAVSETSCKPLCLSVIKANPAKEFYSRQGFDVYDEDESFFKMKWDSNKPLD